MKHLRAALLGVAVLAASLSGAAQAANAPAHLEKAVFAGGCFWGVEAVFEGLRGVSNVVAGYSGGAASTAHYEIVSTGTTGHAESVEVTYDPAKISYRQLLDVYFLVAHDPTERNFQGPDEGTQYRSEIFYANDAQKAAAQQEIRELTARKAFSAPIVTLVEPLKAFYAAEAYHQHFYDNNPNYPYIVINDKPKVEELHQKFPELLKHS